VAGTSPWVVISALAVVVEAVAVVRHNEASARCVPINGWSNGIVLRLSSSLPSKGSSHCGRRTTLTMPAKLMSETSS